MQQPLCFSLHKKTFWGGISLLIFSVFIPFLLNVNTFNIIEKLTGAARFEDPILLLTAAINLVILNSARCFPHYIGSFFIAESIILTYKGKEIKLLKAAIVCIIVPPVYVIIGSIHHIHYDFGIPAIILLCLLTLIGRANYSLVSLLKKTLMVSVFIVAFQFLDIMPKLKGLPLGRGETSRDVKLIANFLGVEDTIQTTAMIFFFLLFFVGILLLFLIRDENNLRLVNELKEQNERMAMETRMHALENRTFMEMKHLVHDLKSPLTSAQALVGVLKLAEKSKNSTNLKYLDKIEDSIDRMSNMISEILNENHFTLLSSEDVLSSVLAQISISEYASIVEVQNNAPNQMICVNKIRMTRALVNLIENSFYAINDNDGKILITVSKICKDGNWLICFTVQDNGKGMSKNQLESIWEIGFSTRNSHGLGLSFVKKVVTDCGGTIDIESEPDAGTTVILMIPEGECFHE